MADEEVLWSTTILVNNIHCASCVSYIHELLRHFVVRNINVNILSQKIHLQHKTQVSVRDLCRMLADAAFEVHSASSTDQAGVQVFELRSNDDLAGWWTSFTHDILKQSPAKSRALRSSCLSLPANNPRMKHWENCEACRKEASGDVEQYLAPLAARPKQWRTPDVEIGLPEQEINDPAKDDTPYPSPRSGVETEQEKHRLTLSIGGMTCASCTSSITDALAGLDRVQSVTVSLMTNSAEVLYTGSHDLAANLIEAVEDVGFEASTVESVPVAPNYQSARPKASHEGLLELELSISGMTCASCTGSIDRGLRELPFVEYVNTSLMTNSAKVKFSGTENEGAIVEAVEDLGYDCNIVKVIPVDGSGGAAAHFEQIERTIQLSIDGLFCEHCPNRISDALTARFGAKMTINRLPSQVEPIISVTYAPDPPVFTIRDITSVINDAHEAFSAHVHHPRSLEEQSHAMQTRERNRILIRVLFSLIIAIPTLLVGVIWMSVVPSSNKTRTFLMQPIWAGDVTRAEWALLIMATPVYFFAADIFHIRALKEIRALWGRKSKVPILRRFYRFGSMNLLISAGTSVAYISSLALLIMGASSRKSAQSSTYFDSVVFLTFFILLGRYLEAYSKSKSGDIVSMLDKLRPDEVTLLNRRENTISKEESRIDGSDVGKKPEKDSIRGSQNSDEDFRFTQKISADLLEVGDMIIVPHGSSPSADGLIVSPNATMDESSLTGESRAIKKVEGEKVFAGSINIGGPITVKITEIGGKSMLDRIIRVVREGQATRAPVERVVDSMTAYFVPIVTALAIVTFVVWVSLGYSGVLSSKYLADQQGGWAFWSLEFAIAVFVVACPCGIGLAAPTALFVGGGLAAKHGILVRGGGEAFQEASKVDVVVFDKTGTLTEGGDLKVTDHEVLCDGWEREMVWSISRALEETSTHPLARAIVQFAEQQSPQIQVVSRDISEIAGLGLRGIVEFQRPDADEPVVYEAAIGSEALIESLEASDEKKDNYFASTILSKWKSQAKSIAILCFRQISPPPSPKSNAGSFSTSDDKDVTTGWKPALLLATSDPLRPTAPPTIAALKKRGIQVYMLTGDNPATAAAVASSLSLPADHVFAGVLPTEKAEKVRWLQDHGPKRDTSRSWIHHLLRRALSTLFCKNSKDKTTATSSESRKSIVAFVGDGINDAPALATSPVSISLASASSIALTSSSFILLNTTSSLTSILTLLDLSERVFRRVQWNFAWAVGYNVILVPIAAGVLFRVKEGGWRLGPVWAAGAMALSSVSVGVASLALRWEGGWSGLWRGKALKGRDVE